MRLSDAKHPARRVPTWRSCLGAAVMAALLPARPADAAAAAPRCAPISPEPSITRLAPQVWRIEGAAGDSSPDNHGRISNLLAVRDGPRLWLLGSGPDAAFARALDCRLARRTGRTVSDVIAPWPRPELVLGQAGLPAARRWAHAEVAAAMRERCPRCIARLAERTGRQAQAPRQPIVLPDRLLQGESGRLGPWQWRRLRRSDETAVTVWLLPAQRIGAAHGLLWSDGAPDLRDSRIASMQSSLQALQTLREPAAGPGWTWVPEQGEPLDDAGVAEHLDYLETLQRQAGQAQADGTLETDPPPAPQAPRFARGARHALNWQLAWREAEQRWFEAGAPAPR